MSQDDRKPRQPNTWKRRQILKGTAAAGGGLVLASGLGIGPSAIAAAPLQVPRRVLGKTGEKIPILCMGGSLPLDPRFDPKLAECVKYGINYFDQADCYSGGEGELALGAFHSRANLRSRIWITTKSDDKDPKGFEETFHKSLEKLKTDYVDMYFLHGLKRPEQINDDLKVVVEKLRKEKKLRFFGFSCHDGTVAELLELAAKTPWIDAVMFRYNFQQYGNDKLNRAIDAAHKANVGLIAMKTQGSAISFEPQVKKFEQTGKWNRYQAVMKAVWADERITAAVSDMDNLDKLRENIAAALDKTKLTQAEVESLYKYAAATRGMTCDGCDHLCSPHVHGASGAGAALEIGPTLRYLMYHDVYGKSELAKDLFRKLPPAARTLSGVDFSHAQAACPHGVDIAHWMRRAVDVLA
jgi:predicted aldo/keto reductase-like oxidoreductase